MTPYLILVLAVFGLFAAVLFIYSTQDQLARARAAHARRTPRAAPARHSPAVRPSSRTA